MLPIYKEKIKEYKNINRFIRYNKNIIIEFHYKNCNFEINIADNFFSIFTENIIIVKFDSHKYMRLDL